MDHLEQYKTVRNFPPTEIPGGVRWYTSEEVSAYRTIVSCGKGTPRQWEIYNELLWEIEFSQRDPEGPMAPPPDMSTKTFIRIDLGGVITGGLLAIVLLGAAVLFGNYVVRLWEWMLYYTPWSFAAMAIVLLLAAIAVPRVPGDNDLPNNDNWV